MSRLQSARLNVGTKIGIENRENKMSLFRSRLGAVIRWLQHSVPFHAPFQLTFLSEIMNTIASTMSVLDLPGGVF